MEHSDFIAMLESLDTLAPSQRRLLSKALATASESDDSILIRFIERNFDNQPSCPRCHSVQIRRWGKQSGRQRYRCQTCLRTFNALTKSPFAHLRVVGVIDSYISTMLDSVKLRQAAAHCNISLPTSFRLRHRIMAVIEGDKANLLSGIAEMDETFFRESFKGQRGLSRPARKRGGRKWLRAHKKQHKPTVKQIPVLVAMDRDNHVIDGVLRHVNCTELNHLLEQHIAPETPLCADAHLAHEAVAKKLHVVLKELVTSEGITVLEEVFHIQHVNAYHSHLKTWINGGFHGVATKYLYKYLGWRRLLFSKNLDLNRFLERIAGHWSMPLLC